MEEARRRTPPSSDGNAENAEDAGTLAYLEDTARQAGLETTLLDIEAIGWRDDGGFVDLDNREIELAFKLYPWEWMFHDAFGERLAKAPTRWIEPPWKAILSNKGMLAIAVGDVSGPPQFAAGLFRGRSERREPRRLLRAQAAVFPGGANVALVRGGMSRRCSGRRAI